MNAITFSTLACPHWSIKTVIEKATELGYDGIEWRGGAQGHVQPTMPAAQKSDLQKMLVDTGLSAIAVTAYTTFVSDLAEERQSNVDELRSYVDLAADLDATYVRTFLGELPEGTAIDSSMYEKITECLTMAADYAESVGVQIAVEPHDDFVRASTILPILTQLQHPALRVIWDIGNAFAAGDDLKQSFELLKHRIAYVQVKDGMGHGADWQLCPLGQGHVPLAKAFSWLSADGYEGTLSVEWEYAWHPELEPPETALPAALKTVRELLVASQTESA
jgi:sugar phosphate isomerase/epimerase